MVSLQFYLALQDFVDVIKENINTRFVNCLLCFVYLAFFYRSLSAKRRRIVSGAAMSDVSYVVFVAVVWYGGAVVA